MNAKQLKKWKERQEEMTHDVIGSIQNPHPNAITKLYPEFHLEGAYTTSLDPYTPVWALVPFFKKVIVGITPYLKTEEDFRKWYGVTAKQILQLKEMGRAEIRILYPHAMNTTPNYLNCFFDANFPSTIRDKIFDFKLLGEDKKQEIEIRFQEKISHKIGEISIDGFSGHKKRAITTAKSAYMQLFCLGYEESAYQFEDMILRDIDIALRWLELCRLFLVGPIHYSLNGIHSVSQNTPAISTFTIPQVVKFPSELGKIFVETFELVKFKEKVKSFTLNDCIAVYPDYEMCRNALLELDSAINKGQENHILKSAHDLRTIIEMERKKNKTWIHLIKIVASTGISIATLPLDITAGILTGLGFATASEFLSSKIDKHISPFASKLSRTKNHLNLLLKLDENIRNNYQIKE